MHFEHLPVSLPLNLAPGNSTCSCSTGSTSSPSHPAQAEGSCCSPCCFCMSNQHLRSVVPDPRDAGLGQDGLSVCSAIVLTHASLQALGDSFPSELAPVITLGEGKRRQEGRVHCTSHRLLSGADLDRGCFSLLWTADCVRHQGSVREASRRWSLVSCLERTFPAALAEGMAAQRLGQQGSPWQPAANHQRVQQLAETLCRARQCKQKDGAQRGMQRPSLSPRTNPRAPTQPARSCSGAGPPASTQGHPHFS